MKPTEIRQVFLSVLVHKNIFTPIVCLEDYGQSRANENLLYERSYGRGIISPHMVGITVLERTKTGFKRRPDLNELFTGDNLGNLKSLAREYGEHLV